MTRGRAVVAAMVGGCIAWLPSPAQADQQTVQLSLASGPNAGWNLIALYLDPAAPNDVPSVFASLLSANRVRSIWQYDAASGSWLSYIPKRLYRVRTGCRNEAPLLWSLPPSGVDRLFRTGRSRALWASDGVLQALLIDPQRLNVYAYARSNPLNRVDPSGNADEPVAKPQTTAPAGAVAEQLLPVGSVIRWAGKVITTFDDKAKGKVVETAGKLLRTGAKPVQAASAVRESQRAEQAVKSEGANPKVETLVKSATTKWQALRSLFPRIPAPGFGRAADESAIKCRCLHMDVHLSPVAISPPRVARSAVPFYASPLPQIHAQIGKYLQILASGRCRS